LKSLKSLIYLLLFDKYLSNKKLESPLSFKERVGVSYHLGSFDAFKISA
jgi:hypothetical protein